MAPGFYTLELQCMSPDAYVVSAKVSGRDILPNGVQIDSYPQIDILFATPGGTVEGTVTDSKDETINDAVVALVPDGPMRPPDLCIAPPPVIRKEVSAHFLLRLVDQTYGGEN